MKRIHKGFESLRAICTKETIICEYFKSIVGTRHGSLYCYRKGGSFLKNKKLLIRAAKYITIISLFGFIKVEVQNEQV